MSGRTGKRAKAPERCVYCLGLIDTYFLRLRQGDSHGACFVKAAKETTCQMLMPSWQLTGYLPCTLPKGHRGPHGHPGEHE